MLPTEKASSLVYNNTLKGLFCVKGIGILAKFRAGSCTNQHLYLVSDEEPKEGDWGIGSDQLVYVPKGYDSNGAGLKKIISTTNPELWRTFIFEKGIYDNGVAKIGLDFVEAYAREQGKIKEVLLEYQQGCSDCGGSDPMCNILSNCSGVWFKTLKLRDNGTVIIHPVKTRAYTEEEMEKAFNAGGANAAKLRVSDNKLTMPVYEFKEWINKLNSLQE